MLHGMHPHPSSSADVTRLVLYISLVTEAATAFCEDHGKRKGSERENEREFDKCYERSIDTGEEENRGVLPEMPCLSGCSWANCFPPLFSDNPQGYL